MSKPMINIRIAINNQLKAIHPRVYFMKAPETATFPYLVYELEITYIEDDLYMVSLDVDGWDKGNDTTALETLMRSVQKELKKTILINDNLAIFLEFDRAFPLTDPDATINRRKYIFNGRLYER
jgi:hypothetical protein